MALAIVFVVALARPVSAASSASKSAGEFGTLSGRLYNSSAHVYGSVLLYEFSFETRVSKNPGTAAKLYANIVIQNNDTGACIDAFTDNGYWQPGDTVAGYYYELDCISNIRNITVAVFGSHEARYTSAYVVYTERTYNLYRDHGIQ